MIFSSSLFLLYFLPVFLLVYHIVPVKIKNWVILLASLFFYAWGAPKFVFVVVGSVIIDFYLINAMHKSNETSRRNNDYYAEELKYVNYFFQNNSKKLALSLLWYSGDFCFYNTNH